MNRNRFSSSELEREKGIREATIHVHGYAVELNEAIRKKVDSEPQYVEVTMKEYFKWLFDLQDEYRKDHPDIPANREPEGYK